MGWLDRLSGKRPGPPQPQEPGQFTVSATLTTFERVSVVGESHYQAALRSVSGAAREEEVRHDCFAELIPEPDNPHDPNAVMVLIDGKHVGYLSRADAVKYGPQVRAMLGAGQPTICNAFVGCLPESGNPNLGVSLEIPVAH